MYIFLRRSVSLNIIFCIVRRVSSFNSRFSGVSGRKYSDNERLSYLPFPAYEYRYTLVKPFLSFLYQNEHIFVFICLNFVLFEYANIHKKSSHISQRKSFKRIKMNLLLNGYKVTYIFIANIHKKTLGFHKSGALNCS